MSTINTIQGQTLYIEITIYDSAGAVMTSLNADGVFAYTNCAVVTEIEGTITSGIFYATMTAVQTAALRGNYSYEVKVKNTDNDDLAQISTGTLVVAKSMIPDYDG